MRLYSQNNKIDIPFEQAAIVLEQNAGEYQIKPHIAGTMHFTMARYPDENTANEAINDMQKSYSEEYNSFQFP